MYFGLPDIITPVHIQKLTHTHTDEILPLGIQNIVGIRNQMTTIILYQVTSRFLSIIKSIYVSTKVSNTPFLIFVQAPLFSFRHSPLCFCNPT